MGSWFAISTREVARPEALSRRESKLVKLWASYAADLVFVAFSPAN